MHMCAYIYICTQTYAHTHVYINTYTQVSVNTSKLLYWRLVLRKLLRDLKHQGLSPPSAANAVKGKLRASRLSEGIRKNGLSLGTPKDGPM